MPRTRSKDPVTLVYRTTNNGNLHSQGQINTFCDSLTDEKHKPCNLKRNQWTPCTSVEVNGPWMTTYDNWIGSIVDPALSFNEVVSPYVNTFDSSKLPTSNQFDALVALAEVDDTIAMFGKKLASSASYGGYKWGWSPLMNDISAVNDVHTRVKNSVLDGNRRSSAYSDSHSYTVKKKYVGISNAYDVTHTWDVKVKHTGSMSYENDILAFYDYLGFHPSPKVLWDLVPFSFALDWVLPVGDLLEKLTPQKGWVKSANFSGWQVVTATLNETATHHPGGSLTQCRMNAKLKTVTRSLLSGVAFDTKSIPRNVDFLKVPTLGQAFDIAYLAKTFASGRKAR